MQSTIKHFLPLTYIHRTRLLPIPGKVLVRKGQEIKATDIIAEANLIPEYMLVDLAQGLGVSVTRLNEVVQVNPGDEVYEGDVLAGPVGFTHRVVRAQYKGRVVVIHDGLLLLEINSTPFQLKAGYSGEVVELIEDRGVMIETYGTLVQGVWGNGLMDIGLLSVLIRAPSQTANIDNIDINDRGSIALVGHCESSAILEKAIELPLRGLIFSSLNPSLIDMVRNLPIPVMVIEGFGKHALNPLAFKLLSEHNQNSILLNAECHSDHMSLGITHGINLESRRMPEIVIPAAKIGTETPPFNLPLEMAEFQVGQRVRAVSSPFIGRTGILMALLGSLVFANGVRADAGEVKLENGETIVIPLLNLEILA